MNTYLDNLVAYRKKKIRLFKWKVVEAYRAERVQASELEERPGISGTELRRLNRCRAARAVLSVPYPSRATVDLLYPSKRHGPPLRSNHETRR